MGNQISNFNPSYKLWAHHRGSLKASKDRNAPTKEVQPSHTTKNIPTQPHSQKYTVQQKAVSHKELPTNKSDPSHNKPVPPSSLQPLSPEVIRSRIPSVITGNNVAPMSEQLIKENPNSLGDIQKRQSTKRVQTVGTKPALTQKNIQTILVNYDHQSASQERTVTFASKIDSIDLMKAQVKAVRTRIDTIAHGQQKEYVWILKQLENEKKNGLRDPPKALFLIKQSIDYEKLIVGLRTKRQIIVRILNDLNQQQISENMQAVLDDVNRYIDGVQQQFIKIDWRAIIMETAVNMQRYVELTTAASTEAEVVNKYNQMEQEVRPKKQQGGDAIQMRNSNASQLSLNNNPNANLQKPQNLPNPQNPQNPQNLQNPKLPPPKQTKPQPQIPVKDPRMSHQIMIDDIQKMIAGEYQREPPVRGQNKQIINPKMIPNPKTNVVKVNPSPNLIPLHQQQVKLLQKQRLK